MTFGAFDTDVGVMDREHEVIYFEIVNARCLTDNARYLTEKTGCLTENAEYLTKNTESSTTDCSHVV